MDGAIINDKTFIMFENVECEQSLYIFSKDNCIRRSFYKLYKKKSFDNFILSCIVVSSIKLVIDTYYDAEFDSYADGGEKNFVKFLEIIDLVFNGVFIMEMIIKVIALGFLFDFNSYLRDTWSQLDFIIVFFSIIDMSLAG